MNRAITDLPRVATRLQSIIRSILPREQLANVHTLDQTLDLLERLGPRFKAAAKEYKGRFTVMQGKKQFIIDAGDIATFTANNKIVYLLTHEGTRYIVNYRLEQLESLLDPRHFFRLNRSVIVNARAILQVKPHVNSRLKLLIRLGEGFTEAIISRDRVAAFRRWANA